MFKLSSFHINEVINLGFPKGGLINITANEMLDHLLENHYLVDIQIYDGTVVKGVAIIFEDSVYLTAQGKLYLVNKD